VSVASGREKYARKTGPGSAAAAKYDAAKGQMVANWQAGLSAAGAPPGPLTTQAYQAGISAAAYHGGDPAKWERNFRAAMSR
jgi:hypothetical protein